MGTNNLKRLISLVLVILVFTSFVGCNDLDNNSTLENKSTTIEETTGTDSAQGSFEETSSDALPEEEDLENDLTEQQLNSFSMLYYLAITAEEIRVSKDNRLMLDEIYTSLLNDINPGAIDETTQEHLQNLRDIIKSYMDISVKRERLQYIYNQDKAETIRSAVPNPLSVLSTTQSLNWKSLVASVVYTAVDSYNNYKSANATVDKEFLISGWELDDEEVSTIQKNRERAFDYMVDIVQEYGLDGNLTLNEKSIETFVEICAIDSVQQKNRRLESEKETFKLLGNYWLELADCYYETSQYQKCLDCVDKYNSLATGIYRKDYNYVQILPKAIVAAQEVYTGDEYVSVISEFADSIIENTTTEDWSTRYFVAQVYLDLYSKTNVKSFLENAYDIAYDNVTILLDEQCVLNSTYLADVVEETIEEPDYNYMTDEEEKAAKEEYEAEKKRLKEYNKGLKESRKTELPPLYEPLIVNCDLLFSLARQMNISDAEKSEIEDILQTKKNGVFFADPVNDRYSFSKKSSNYSVELTKNKIKIPANMLTEGAEIIVNIIDGDNTTICDDCVVTKVERDGDKVANFNAFISSDKMNEYKWTANSKVTIKIYNRKEYEATTLNYKVVEYDDNWVFPDKVVFGKA